MTKKEMFGEIITLANGGETKVTAEEIVNFAEHEIELLSRKNGTSKPTKNQVENEGYKKDILIILAEKNKAMTISELMEDDRLAGLKNQRVSAIVTQLKNAGKVVRTVEKKKAYFSLADNVEVEA